MQSLPQVEPILQAMAQSILDEMQKRKIDSFHVIGIRTGGVWVAQALQEIMGRQQDIGELNITFYRDDFTQIGLHPQVTPSSLPFEIDNQHLVLVDDVLMSGRTVRAAMNELFDYGRPSSITFAVLIDLGQPELPIAPHITGAQVQLDPKERIKLIGPENLQLKIEQLEQDEG